MQINDNISVWVFVSLFKINYKLVWKSFSSLNNKSIESHIIIWSNIILHDIM